MTEIFKKTGKISEQNSSWKVGMTDELNDHNVKLELIGSPADPETLKCILTAAEHGLEMNCYSIITDTVDESKKAINEVSPLLSTPILKEAEFVTSGSDAITSYIDTRGSNYSLSPDNAELAAIQSYWVDIAVTNVAPKVHAITEEAIIKQYQNPDDPPNLNIIRKNCESLSVFLDAFDRQLSGNKYIVCDKYTWADVHWTPYIHLCEITGCAAIIERRDHIKHWFNRIKTRKSQSGMNLVAYDCLPGSEQTRKGKLNSIHIGND